MKGNSNTVLIAYQLIVELDQQTEVTDTKELCVESMNSKAIITDLARYFSLSHSWAFYQTTILNTTNFSKFVLIPLILINKHYDGNFGNAVQSD